MSPSQRKLLIIQDKLLKIRGLYIVSICLSVIVLPLLNSCKTITSFVHDGKVVAKVGEHKLYESELLAYIPSSANSEDSTKLALQYINTWASDMVFNDVAESELSKSEKDVEKELNDYKRSLLKFRYEQKYVNQRLDTAISYAQIEKYYQERISNFHLQLPIAKVKFFRILADSPNLAVLKKKIASSKPEDMVEADSLARISALHYTTFNGQWVDLVTLSREFGTDYGSVLATLKDHFVEMPDGNGNINVAYIAEMQRAGETGPVEYYEEQIRDIILGTRKQALLSALERDLLENARNRKDFVIY